MNKKLYGKARKMQRQKEAIERQEKRESRTSEEQLKVLDSRFGEELGAKKERYKLVEVIEKRLKKHKKKSKKKRNNE
jgi:hypothetical protein|tara:strand:- start:134 stop:364 length:231 start_codon:yes stop_codon:yes gene_type:complete